MYGKIRNAEEMRVLRFQGKIRNLSTGPRPPYFLFSKMSVENKFILSFLVRDLGSS